MARAKDYLTADTEYNDDWIKQTPGGKEDVEIAARVLAKFTAQEQAEGIIKTVKAHNIIKDAIIRAFKGGPGSGHHGHKGVPGERGGSAPSVNQGNGGVNEMPMVGHFGKGGHVIGGASKPAPHVEPRKPTPKPAKEEKKPEPKKEGVKGQKNPWNEDGAKRDEYIKKTVETLKNDPKLAKLIEKRDSHAADPYIEARDKCNADPKYKEMFKEYSEISNARDKAVTDFREKRDAYWNMQQHNADYKNHPDYPKLRSDYDEAYNKYNELNDAKDKKSSSLKRYINKIEAQVNGEREKETIAVMNRAAEILKNPTGGNNIEARFPDNATVGGHKLQAVAQSRQEVYQEVMRNINKIVAKDSEITFPEKAVRVFEQGGNSSFHLGGTNAIGLSRKVAGTERLHHTAHEIGHFLEQSVKNARRNMNTFYAWYMLPGITKLMGYGYSAQQVSNALKSPGMGSSAEILKAFDYLTQAYAAKRYFGRDSTEVMSTTLAHMLTNPIEISTKNPEMVQEVLNNLWSF